MLFVVPGPLIISVGKTNYQVIQKTDKMNGRGGNMNKVPLTKIGSIAGQNPSGFLVRTMTMSSFESLCKFNPNSPWVELKVDAEGFLWIGLGDKKPYETIISSYH